jgi:uncharacterized protein
MFISAILPFLFLISYGRMQIGIRKSKNPKCLFGGIILGLSASIVLYFIAELFYQDSFQNWYRYIARTYRIPPTITWENKKTMFFIVAGTSMVFSPIGEELFFRGIVHASFSKSLGEKKATLLDSSAFAITHLSHFGLVYVNTNWDFYLIPSLIWISSMFLVSVLFSKIRHKTESILGAILCHAAFNLGMTYCIFFPFIG